MESFFNDGFFKKLGYFLMFCIWWKNYINMEYFFFKDIVIGFFSRDVINLR